MVDFNELSVNAEGTTLTVDVSIKSVYDTSGVDTYQNVYIDYISIDTQDTFITGGPSSSPIYTVSYDDSNKQVVLTLDKLDLGGVDLNKTLFFIWVVTRGTPSSTVSCGEDNYINLGVTYAKYPFYRLAVNVMGELLEEEECRIPKNFIDSFLRLKAIHYAVLTEQWEKAIKLWDKLVLKDNSDAYSVTRCNCNKT